jgi:plastocyanin domain-containing protein
MVERFDKALCEEKHKTIDQNTTVLFHKIDQLLWAVITSMGLILLAVLTTFLTLWSEKKNEPPVQPVVSAYHEQRQGQAHHEP